MSTETPSVWSQKDFPNFKFDIKQIHPLQRLYERASGELYGAHDTLSAEDQQEVRLDLFVSEAISSASIEGENLNRESVRNSLKRQLGVSHDPKRQDQESEGMARMLLSSRARNSQKLSQETLFDWHRDVLGDGRSLLYKDLLVGQWRQDEMEIVSGPIGFRTVDYTAPPAEAVPHMMEGFLQWFNDPSHASVSDVMRSEHCAGPVRAALAHLWFELVHPFDDGNGRVGRAIADMALCQSETKPPLFNLSTVLLQHRDDYYKALSSASRTLDATDWIVWFFHRTIEAQVQAKSVVHTIIEKTRFWDRVRRSGDGFLNDRQEKVLSALFMHEPVGFEGGMSARKYASLTRVSKATATRDLTDLTNKRCLLLVGSGRAARYYLNTRKYQALFNAPVPTP